MPVAPALPAPAAQPGHPENYSQALIAAFRKSFSPAALSRLGFAKIQAAVTEELTMMTEAPQIAGFGQNRKRHNGRNYLLTTRIQTL